MQITLDELFKGKATKIRNKNFNETKRYVEPFLERMSNYTDDFVFNVKLPEQITRTKTGDIDMDDITFNRVWVQAILPDELSVKNHKEVIGMVYGLDCRKPVVKFYNGGLNMACTNLCVFSPNQLHVHELEPETAIDYKPLDNIIHNTEEICKMLLNMSNTNLPGDKASVERMLGGWIIESINSYNDFGFGKVKISPNSVIDAYKDLFINSNSDYFINSPESNGVNMFRVYNAFTQQITDDSRDIMNHFEKTLLLRNILKF